MIWEHSPTLLHNQLAFDTSKFDAALARGSQRGHSDFALDGGLAIGVAESRDTL